MVHQLIKQLSPDKIFLLTDSNVGRILRDRIAELEKKIRALTFIIPAGESNKNIDTLQGVLAFLTENQATRRSLLICLGGGMVTDLGGFAAAIFKRGIRHINIATTVLGAVDAAVGGKTAIDFLGYKNEIGAFHLPVATLFDVDAFSSLPEAEILSGFGEIAKTALLAGKKWTDILLGVDPAEAPAQTLEELCRFCRDYKNMIVSQDPTEKGLRKVLNLGHTAGHAIESLLIEKGKGVPHGIAVAYGNLVSLVLSNMMEGLDSSVVCGYAAWLKNFYPAPEIGCRDYDRIWEIATHDKKNDSGSMLNFTLLRPEGKGDKGWTPVYDIRVDRTQFEEALDIFRELSGTS